MQQKLFEEEFPEDKERSSCPVIKKGRVKLTPAQSEFNRLNKKIAALKTALAQLPERQRRVVAFYQECIVPLEKEADAMMLKALCDLDNRYEAGGLSEDESEGLSEVILDKCSEFLDVRQNLSEADQEMVKRLLNKHELILSGLSQEEFDKQKLTETIHLFSIMTGLKPTAKMKKAKSEEELSKLISEYLEKKISEESGKSEKEDPFGKQDGFYEKKEEPQPKQKMTQAALKRKIQEEQVKKSVRSIYMELAKTIHPDLEQDESLRAVKEERMKLLTEAYRRNDLAALLTMQINWLEESVNSNLEEKPDALLKGFNKVLRTQLKKLEEELDMAVFSRRDLPHDLCELLKVSLQELDLHLEHFKREEQAAVEAIRKNCKSWSSKRGLNKLIRESRQKNDLSRWLDDFFTEGIF